MIQCDWADPMSCEANLCFTSLVGGIKSWFIRKFLYHRVTKEFQAIYKQTRHLVQEETDVVAAIIVQQSKFRCTFDIHISMDSLEVGLKF